MLVEIFRTVPLPYREAGDPDGAWFGAEGAWYSGYGANQDPYMESLSNYWGISVLPEPLPNSPESIYLWTTMGTNAWPSFAFGYGRWNAVDGSFVKRFSQSGGGQSLFFSAGITTSFKGNLWFGSIYGDQILRCILGSTATTLVFDDPEKVDSWYTTDDIVNASKFQGAPDEVGGDPGTFGLLAIDDAADYFLNVQFASMHVYRWSSGNYVHTITLPSEPAALALEDPGRVYILGKNRVLYLLDYIRNEVMGVSKIPPTFTVGSGTSAVEFTTNLSQSVFTYDRIYKRILIAQETANNPDTGASTNIIRGYRQVPAPTRLTPPIPLKAPRQRRTIPVLVQALDDVNKGVGGYIIDAEVTGSGSLIGFPMSDGEGNSILHVALEGDPSYSGDEDWETTGSPEVPHTGLVSITCEARVMGIPPSLFPVSGVEGGGEGGSPAPPGGSNRYIWDWHDQNPSQPAPDAPGSPGGAPTTMAEWEAYFFEIADRVKGDPANDYQDVLLALRDAGMHVNPQPFEVPDEDWPFFGMSVMIDANGAGVPRGRIWLPTSTPDDNGYYVHEIQVIADDLSPAAAETAPNMFSILEQTYNSRTWRLQEAYEAEADGRGAFVEAAVQTMHDHDARFGHIRKNPGQQQYNGHAVNALVFKNDDGTTGEIFTVVTSSGELCWQFVDRSEANLSKWYYPA